MPHLKTFAVAMLASAVTTAIIFRVAALRTTVANQAS